MSARRRPVVALVGQPDDPHLLAVQDHLQNHDVHLRHLDFSQVDRGAAFTVDGSQAFLDGVPLTGVHAALVRQVPSPWPPLEAGADGEAVVLAKWMAPFMLAREREQAVLSILHGWHARGAAMLNPPTPTGFSQNKPLQLELARQLGLPVPPTCITNDAATAVAFVERVKDAVAKPLHGGALTVALRPQKGLRRQLASIAAAPVILQQRMPGKDVRLYMLGRRVLSCCSVELEDGPHLDFRASAQYQRGRATYQHVDLPPPLLALAARWMKRCGLTLGGMDVKLDAQGNAVFLECNSAPIYLDQERKTGDAISHAIAGWLARRAAARC